MKKEEYIIQQLGAKIGSLEVLNAQLVADNQLLSQKVQELTETDENDTQDEEKGDE